MSTFRLAALACAAVSFVACAGGSRPGTPAPSSDVAAREAPAGAACTLCTVEVENRFDFQAMVFDRRDTQNQVGEIKPLGKVLAKATTVVQTKGRPNLGMAVIEDTGTPPTAKGLKFCRQVPVAPGSSANYRYACGY